MRNKSFVLALGVLIAHAILRTFQLHRSGINNRTFWPLLRKFWEIAMYKIKLIHVVFMMIRRSFGRSRPCPSGAEISRLHFGLAWNLAFCVSLSGITVLLMVTKYDLCKCLKICLMQLPISTPICTFLLIQTLGQNFATTMKALLTCLFLTFTFASPMLYPIHPGMFLFFPCHLKTIPLTPKY